MGRARQSRQARRRQQREQAKRGRSAPSRNPNWSLLYWLHTHDSSGIIHIEAPRTITPTLGMFFDIWDKPLSRAQVARVRVRSGQTMKVYVNRKPYAGDPRAIRLHAHTLVTIEVGPPFPAPRTFDFGNA